MATGVTSKSHTVISTLETNQATTLNIGQPGQKRHSVDYTRIFRSGSSGTHTIQFVYSDYTDLTGSISLNLRSLTSKLDTSTIGFPNLTRLYVRSETETSGAYVGVGGKASAANGIGTLLDAGAGVQSGSSFNIVCGAGGHIDLCNPFNGYTTITTTAASLTLSASQPQRVYYQLEGRAGF